MLFFGPPASRLVSSQSKKKNKTMYLKKRGVVATERNIATPISFFFGLSKIERKKYSGAEADVIQQNTKKKQFLIEHY